MIKTILLMLMFSTMAMAEGNLEKLLNCAENVQVPTIASENRAYEEIRKEQRALAHLARLNVIDWDTYKILKIKLQNKQDVIGNRIESYVESYKRARYDECLRLYPLEK